MRKLQTILTIILAIAVGELTGTANDQTAPGDMAKGQSNILKLVAHRGEEALAPEGSVPAYKLAIKHHCDIVKMDVHETKDGIVVMSHDPTLKRTMGWDTKISDVTLAEIREKGVFKPVGGYNNEKIVTLKEALEIVKDSPEFWIDFKHFTPVFAEKTLAEFAAAGINENRLMVATFTEKALSWIQKNRPTVRRVLHCGIPRNLQQTNNDFVAQILAKRDKYGLFGINLQLVQGKTRIEDIAALKKAGLWVAGWDSGFRPVAKQWRVAELNALVTRDLCACRD